MSIGKIEISCAEHVQRCFVSFLKEMSTARLKEEHFPCLISAS